MGSGPSVHECTACKAMFRTQEELVHHLSECPRYKRRQDPDAFTVKLDSRSRAETPGTVPVSESTASKRGSVRPSFEDASPLRAISSGLKKTNKSGLEMSVLSSIAEGDAELVAAYERLNTSSSGTRARTLTPEIVSEVARKAKIDMGRVADLFSMAENVSICFLLDTTGSMAPYIEGVKDQIVQIVHQVESSGCGIAGLAFVGYKDWCDGENHFEILPFTMEVMKFKNFVEGIRAGGGGDPPEDVVGGLDQAVRLSWPEGSETRVLFHLGDDPPHGRGKYHNDRYDDYPKGHPKDRPLAALFQEMKRKKISYYFGRINDHCDKMIGAFESHYGEKIDKLNSSKVSKIATHVTSSVMKSVSATCSSTLSTIKLSGSVLRTFVLDLKEPDWSRIPEIEATILTFQLPESIRVIKSFARLDESVCKCRVQIAPNPFAKGSIRLAYRGHIIRMIKDGDGSRAPARRTGFKEEVVFKEMISLPKVADLDRQRYMVDLEVQTVASKLAFEFNDRLARTSCDPNVKLKFLMAKVIRTVQADGITPRFMAYEKRFRDPTQEMVKYTNNLNFVLNPDTLDEAGRTQLELAIAFSHFTHSVTDGYLLVCDLQGIFTVKKKKKPTLLLTDPAIHCAKHLRFGKTNLGETGIRKFFANHACNHYCRALDLTMPSEK